MGAIIDGLDDHEGYALWRLADGSLVPAWSPGVREFTAYVAGCECGWHAEQQHPPTEAGAEAAYAQWEHEHALAELTHQADHRRAELAQALRVLGGIADFVDNPANLARIARAANRVQTLVDDLQRDLERRPIARETDGGR
jgi:hypothetical protein